jgi:hypothetical protein
LPCARPARRDPPAARVMSNDTKSSGPKDQFIRHSEQCWTGSAREANRKFSYVAAAHARSPASPTSSGVDFSLSGAAHLHAGRRLSLPRPIASGLTLEMDRYTSIDDCSHCKIPSLNAWFSTSQARSRLLRTLLSETPLLLVQ